ncbi:hypothetical protein CEXT_738801 [Caerostris extrusa]|uniref:Uncharacterized protein n=1 Tax=Caerostris extrusa TaxID=172846 RepID=A0AAV4QMM2_CAEEX|nr:hypothetical protein CEXT_738801 [Caerostris extrusa]
MSNNSDLRVGEAPFQWRPNPRRQCPMARVWFNMSLKPAKHLFMPNLVSIKCYQGWSCFPTPVIQALKCLKISMYTPQDCY